MARLSPGRLASVEESAESSESEHECEPAKIFARRLSTQKNVKSTSVSLYLCIIFHGSHINENRLPNIRMIGYF